MSRVSKQGKGGLLIAVQKSYFSSVMEVTTSVDKNILSARVSLTENRNLRIILGYGPQENQSVEDREAFITELTIEVQKSINSGDCPMVIGDLNAKIDKEGEEVVAESPNGKLLKEVVDQYGLSVMNFDKRCKGKWTHVIRTTGETSVLDYIITKDWMKEDIEEMMIDEECLICPFRMKKDKGESTVQFTDHNSIIVKAKIARSWRRKKEAEVTWKCSDDGLETLRTMTKEDSYLPPTMGNDPQNNYDVLENEVYRLMNGSFRRVTQKQKPRTSNEASKNLHILATVSKFSKKGGAQRKVAMEYREMIMELNRNEERKEKAKNFSNAIKSITVNGKFSSQSFWKAKRSIYGKSGDTCTSVFDRNGVEVFGDLGIQETYKEEFSQRLEHRKIRPSLIRYEETTNKLARLLVEEASMSKNTEIKMEELEVVLNELKSGAPGKDGIPPEFYSNTEAGFNSFLLEVLNDLKRRRYTPTQWEDTLIKTIYKNKGVVKVLKNHRGIFLTQVISKVYERIHRNRTKDIMKKVSLFQAGSREERGCPDNLFLMNSCIDHARYLNVPVYITVYDFEQCFDALWLEDCIVALWELGVRDDVLTIMYNMNKQAKIQVKTPAGTSKVFTKPSIVKQGTVAGPAMCSTSTAEFVTANKGVKGFPIGPHAIKTMILVDDVSNTNLDVPDVIQSHKNILAFSNLKRAPLSGGKCFILPVNVKRDKDKERIPVLKVGNTRMEVKEKVMYLGVMYNSKGDNQDLIEHRTQQAKTCMVNSIALCNDVTLGCYAFQALMLTYKTVFLPTLLYGAEVWSNLIENNRKKLASIQLQFLKRILQVPRSTCNSVTFLELGVLPVIFEIHKRKLTFLYHILCKGIDDPVLLTYRQQLQYAQEKNWGNETEQLKEIYKLPEDEKEILKCSKDEWKLKVKEAAVTRAVQDLCGERRTMSRADEFEMEDTLATKAYFYHLNYEHARILFRLRCKNFDIKEWKQHIYTNMTCRVCGEEGETLDHVLRKCRSVTTKPISHRLSVYTEVEELQREIVERVKSFKDQVKRKEDTRD